MEKFQELRDISIKKLQTADHMLTMTYPFVQDPKLLILVIENLFLAATNAMGSVLHYERLFKRIPPFQDTFESKYNMFRLKCADNFDPEHIALIGELKDIIIAHRKSPVEFSKKDRFVICSEDYQMRTISLPGLKEYIQKTKLFIQRTQQIVSKNESLFRGRS
ncbi:MAG TPA: hypothetical protein VJH97_02060 [Candidatus Nanoarchaeia archaeon]|nr:hypothetical protein [Candidatus Nanoarchaeia archaeon]